MFESHPLRLFFCLRVKRDNLKVKEVRCQGYLGPNVLQPNQPKASSIAPAAASPRPGKT
jgi:hypothetical protein